MKGRARVREITEDQRAYQEKSPHCRTHIIWNTPPRKFTQFLYRIDKEEI